MCCTNCSGVKVQLCNLIIKSAVANKLSVRAETKCSVLELKLLLDGKKLFYCFSFKQKSQEYTDSSFSNVNCCPTKCGSDKTRDLHVCLGFEKLWWAFFATFLWLFLHQMIEKISDNEKKSLVVALLCTIISFLGCDSIIWSEMFENSGLMS